MQNEDTSAQDTGINYPSKLNQIELNIIQEALGILESKLKQNGPMFNTPADVKNYCRLQLANELDEHFGCIYLDSSNQLIRYERLFHGTIDGAAVYPRVVVRRVLELNAAAVIFTHNHPSGRVEPSGADIRITSRLKESLNLIEVRVLDHIIVSDLGDYSMAEMGQL